MTLALVVGGCVGGDDAVATFDGAASVDRTTLPPPPVETTSPYTTAEHENGGQAPDVSDPDEDRATTTQPLDQLLGLAAEPVADGFDQPVFVLGAKATATSDRPGQDQEGLRPLGWDRFLCKTSQSPLRRLPSWRTSSKPRYFRRNGPATRTR